MRVREIIEFTLDRRGESDAEIFERHDFSREQRRQVKDLVSLLCICHSALSKLQVFRWNGTVLDADSFKRVVIFPSSSIWSTSVMDSNSYIEVLVLVVFTLTLEEVRQVQPGHITA